MKKNFTDSLLFSLIYFFAFSVMIKSFTSGETQGMLLLISIAIILISASLNFLISWLLNYKNKILTLIARTALLFAISEVALLIIIGQLPLFGLTQKLLFNEHHYSGNRRLDADIYLFQEQRDFAFSSAGFLGALSVFIVKKMFLRNTDKIQTT